MIGPGRPKFELPPPEHRPASVESWKTPQVGPQASRGPSQLLLLLLVIEVGLALFSLYRWEPEELGVAGCPPIQALFSMLVAYYAYKGRNAARLLAFIGAGAWILAAVIVLRSRSDLLDAIPASTRAIVLVRASFEVLLALFLMRSDAARYFEQEGPRR